jgi:hypothetical protein
MTNDFTIIINNGSVQLCCRAHRPTRLGGEVARG